jgi:mercuric ion transport protein
VNQTGIQAEALEAPEERASRKQGWLAAGGVIGAVLASTCCIGPLALLALGVSGAWIGNLAALEPYKPYFAAVALVFIGLGFRRVYFRPKPACAAGSLCARPQSYRITKAALWVASVLVLLALTIHWWAPLFY